MIVKKILVLGLLINFYLLNAAETSCEPVLLNETNQEQQETSKLTKIQRIKKWIKRNPTKFKIIVATSIVAISLIGFGIYESKNYFSKQNNSSNPTDPTEKQIERYDFARQVAKNKGYKRGSIEEYNIECEIVREDNLAPNMPRFSESGEVTFPQSGESQGRLSELIPKSVEAAYSEIKKGEDKNKIILSLKNTDSTKYSVIIDKKDFNAKVLPELKKQFPNIKQIIL